MKNFYLVGHRIKDSLSPLIHQSIYQELGINADYRLFDIDSLEQIKGLFEYSRPYGFNITRPFKSQILPFLSENYSRSKSVNIVMVSELDRDFSAAFSPNDIFSGYKAMGYSTDGLGFVLDANRLGLDLKRIIILGTGGAARALLFELISISEQIYILGRDLIRSRKLADELKEIGARASIAAIDLNSLYPLQSQISLVINCTGVGLKGVLAGQKICLDNLAHYDLRYSSDDLAAFKAGSGNRLSKSGRFSGLGMLIYQAILSAEIMLGQRIGLGIFDKIKNYVYEKSNA